MTTSRAHDLLRTAMTTDDRLDDLARARIWNALSDNLADDERDAPRAAARRRRTVAIAACTGFAAAALAAAIAFVVLRPAPHAPAVATETSVAPDTTLTLPLGPHARAAIIGPARFAVVDRVANATTDATTVRVDAGVLLAEFTGGAGRSLRIVAPHVTVDVLGTLFAVEVRTDETCVSVEHGTVRLSPSASSTSRGGPLAFVTGGHTHCTRSGSQPLAPAMRDALLRHERVITASTDPNLVVPARTPTATGPAAASAPAAAPARVTAPSRTPARAPAAAPAASAVRDAAPAIAKSMPPATISDKPPTLAAVSDKPPTTVVATGSDTPQTTVAASVSDNLPTAASASGSERLPAAVDKQPAAAPVPDKRPAAPPPPATADDLYRDAESALRSRDSRTADRVLAKLVAEFPQSPLVEQALYDRARIAYQQRSWSAARTHLDNLLALPSPRLVEQARYLECRVFVDTHDEGAAACLDNYRRAYPRSPHAADMLGMLVQLDHAAGGCRAAAARIDELVRKHPHSKLAAAWRARCPSRSEQR
jgi:TolA-binding protein